MSSLLGMVIASRYRVDREVGQGGMATVFLARDLKHDREVALKVLRPDLAVILGRERFLTEIRVTAGLDHPHILTLIDSGESDGVLWYVMPLVKGESLRQKLDREGQLDLSEALSIARQLAGALQYAHLKGVIHRDIKPENVLLHEGVAVLTDFGIALAVREASGPRLTETGLSVGTPLYMSPEQASGNRQLDGRSDVYSLAAVIYEMLAGRPPITGASPQAIVARLMTEAPTPLRVIRPGAPVSVEIALGRGLAKAPADRFRTVDELVQALHRVTGVARWRKVGLTGMAIFMVLVAGLVWARARALPESPSNNYANLVQLSFTGNASMPAISPDGRQAAYVLTDCDSSGCRNSIHVRDIGREGARKLLEWKYTVAYLYWAADRRTILFFSDGPRAGVYLVSALGGPARFVTQRFASFTAAGDSLMILKSFRADSIATVGITSMDGQGSDSFTVPNTGGRAAIGVLAFPGGHWLVAGVPTDDGYQARVIDRRGAVAALLPMVPRRGPVDQDLAPRLSREGIWWARNALGATRAPLVRQGFDPATGRLTGTVDTLFDVSVEGFDVTSDGASIVFAKGIYRQILWWIDLDQALQGRFEQSSLRLTLTSLVLGWPSPDGNRLLTLREDAGRPEASLSLSVLTQNGDPLLDLRGPGLVTGAKWAPRGQVQVVRRGKSGTRLSLEQPESETTVRALVLPDSAILDFAALADSVWAWVPPIAHSIRWQRQGDTLSHELPMPGVWKVLGLTASPNGRRLAAQSSGTNDSLLITEVSLANGQVKTLATLGGADAASANWLEDGSLLVVAYHRFWEATLYRIAPDRRTTRLGVIPRRVSFVQSAGDGRRLAVVTREFQGDIWLAGRPTLAH